MKPKETTNAGAPKGNKKRKAPKKKAKKDPNEPQKPISAYALFFRDTQSVIKGQNPNASFGEVSKIVASMWDSLELDNKNLYKERAASDKKEYLKALAAYRATLSSTGSAEHSDSNQQEPSSVAPESPSPVCSSPTADPVEEIEVTNSTTVEANSEPASTPIVETIQLTETDSEPPEVVDIDPPEAPVTEQKSPLPVVTISSPAQEPETGGNDEHNISNGNMSDVVPLCLRTGCANPAIDSPEWDKEYCSSECVVEHCSAVFMAHVAARQRNAALVQS